MKITDSRANDILDDETGNHALLFEKMTLHRDEAALIRKLRAELQDAWQAGLDAGREQGRGKDHPSPSAPVGVDESFVERFCGRWFQLTGRSLDRPRVRACLTEALAALAQQPAVHPRSTHRVWRGDDWQPCYCEATDDHRIVSEQPAAVGVRGLPRYGFPDGNEPRPVPCADGYWTPWHLAQALRNEAHATAAKDAEIEELRADLADYMRIANTEATRAERLAEALRDARDYVTTALREEREKFAGHEDCSDIPGIEADLHKIDALLRDQEEDQ